MVVKKIFFGYPGTGKTTTLINEYKNRLSEKYSPEDICFCAFTKNAANEMKERLSSELGMTKKDLTNVSTIHSLCFRKLGEGRKLISENEIKDFFKLEKIYYENKYFLKDIDTIYSKVLSGFENGDYILLFYDQLRLRSARDINNFDSVDDLKAIYHKLNISNLIPYQKIFLEGFNIYKILKNYHNFKKNNDLLDFTDMLMLAISEDYIIPTKILMVDEFQDLNYLQYKIYKNWSKNKEYICIAGDDDQAIFQFQGARPDLILDEKKIIEKEGGEVYILNKTYRLPKKINEYCLNYINAKIPQSLRVVKNVISNDLGGEVNEIDLEYNQNNILNFLENDKKNLILFIKNSYINDFIYSVCIPKGIVFYQSGKKGLWNQKTIDLYNGVMNFINNNKITLNEVERLIQAIPSKTKLIKYGTKSKFKKSEKKDIYSKEDLFEIGLIKDIDFLKRDNLIGILDLTDKIKLAMINLKQEYIIPNRLVELGTIHQNKGGESDIVIFVKDISQYIVNQCEIDINNKHNLFRLGHVGHSRAKQKLIIIRNFILESVYYDW